MKATTIETIALQLAAPYESGREDGLFWRGDAVRAASDDLAAFCSLVHAGGDAVEALEGIYRTAQRLKALAQLFDLVDKAAAIVESPNAEAAQ